MPDEFRFAVLGAGFWARYQLSAWKEVPGAHCVAVCDPRREKAEALAKDLRVPAVYDDPDKLLAAERLDFVDIISAVESHAPLVRAAAAAGVGIICQKPMAPDLETSRNLVAACRDAAVPFFVHENFRFQAPLRQAAAVLRQGILGRVFRARVDFNSGFPVFGNQPSLKTARQFILSDLGSHTLDIVRFLFGEVTSLVCRTARIHKDIAGEDVATVLLDTAAGAHVVCQMAYAGTPLEQECFPQTRLFVEGDRGSLEVAPDYWVRVTTAEGTHAQRHPPRVYAWANPDYALIHDSIVPCNADILAGLKGARGGGQEGGETTGADNLETLKLVYAAYEAAESGHRVHIGA